MKIRILRNVGTGSGLPPWKEGQEVDVPDSQGKDLVQRGLAEAILHAVAAPALKTVAAPVTPAETPETPPAPADPLPRSHHAGGRKGHG